MRINRLVVASLASLLPLVPFGCATGPAPSAEPKAQLFEGMGTHARATSTSNAEAQRYFDQGLVWAYAFNHDEAVRSFEKAAELDPTFALAWWGVALCHGPHINNPVMPEERSRLAYDAAAKATALAANAPPIERDLVAAVAARYAWPAPADRRPLDEAYAAAMERVHRAYPADNDIATLYAESLMDLQPWDLWTLDGAPKGRTLEIVALLEGVRARDPSHPGAAHLYIHTVEASKDAGRAKAAADMLRTAVPASGHLTHMPSHIDVRTGAWSAAATANRKAIAVDAAYRRLSPRQDFYQAYMQHNKQFLAFTCMMLGRSGEAIDAAQAAVSTLPPEWIERNASLIDGYMTVHMDALKRFGRWDELLALEMPPAYLPYTRAMWRFNRAVALAAKGDIAGAEAEQAAFVAAVAQVPATSIAQINPASRVLELAALMLEGEIAYARKDYAAAERALRDAVAIEDTLLYMEPPDWMQPVRHTLGVVLLDAGRPADARSAYEEDLRRWPENGWSLLGVAAACEALGDSAGAADARARARLAWPDADVSPHATCLCAPPR
jgi:tetratricopeptide (TPR) repeat protein